MELHDLKTFHYIATEQSFSKAAQELFISQPAASASMKKLEFDMGCKLFERAGKSIRLTSAGQILYGYTTRIFEIVHDIHADIEKQSGEIKGNLTIATSDAAGCFLLPQIISSFTAKYENVDIQLNVGSVSIALRLVEEGRADFAIIGGALDDKSHVQLCTEKLADDRVVLIGSNELPLIEEDSLGLNKLGFIMYEKGTALSAAALGIIQTISHSGKHRLSMNSVAAIVQAVKANAGIAAVPLSAVCEDIKSGRVKHLYPAEINIEYPYYIVCLKSRSQGLAEKTLSEFIKTRMATLLSI